MVPLILWLIALFTPEPSLVGLASPKFAVRQKASAELQARMTWPLAVRLTITPPSDPEARYRARLAITAWYRAQVWDYKRPWPYIDALNSITPCEPPASAITVRYLTATYPDADPWRSYKLRDYRTATGLLVADLREDLVPPQMIRWLLAYMDRESIAWDARQRRMPMPQTSEPPLAPVRPQP